MVDAEAGVEATMAGVWLVIAGIAAGMEV